VAVTIVGGALAERCKLQTYLIVAFAVAIWIYPIIVHWCWGQGWLSPHANQTSDYLFYGNNSNNFIDMAGSGVVHTVGGVAGLVGAIALGARKVMDNFALPIRYSFVSLTLSRRVYILSNRVASKGRA
jgi:Amt family ammonium transporter